MPQLYLGSLPPMVIMFSIIAALVSNFLALEISAPLLRIKSIIENFNSRFDNLTSIEVNTNIDEFKKIETFILKSLQEKNKSYQMEREFVKMARMVAHDLRSPVLALEVAVRDVDLDEKTRNLIVESADSIRDIANQILVKYQTDKRKDNKCHVSIATAIFPVVDSVIRQKYLITKSKKIQIVVNVSEQDKKAMSSVNPVLFRRIIGNLLDNALDSFINNKGKIEVEISTLSECLQIAIRDNGCGIPAKLLPKVTQEGFTYGKQLGSGIGLHFVTRCIAAWGGDYEIASTEAFGTTFKFRLPKISSNKKYVLLDDSPAIILSWEVESEKQGCGLSAFTNVDDFMQYIKNCDHTTEIYVDSNLRSNLSGVDILKALYEQGYRNLYLQTGDDTDNYKHLSWIKGIRGKEPPFMGDNYDKP